MEFDINFAKINNNIIYIEHTNISHFYILHSLHPTLQMHLGYALKSYIDLKLFILLSNRHLNENVYIFLIM